VAEFSRESGAFVCSFNLKLQVQKVNNEMGGNENCHLVSTSDIQWMTISDHTRSSLFGEPDIDAISENQPVSQRPECKLMESPNTLQRQHFQDTTIESRIRM
jgi:hypothetical protein